MTDPIVEEVRRVRDAHAAKFDYDLDAIFRDIKEQEQSSGLQYVSFRPRPAEPIPTPPSVAVSDPGSPPVVVAVPAVEL